MHIQITSKQFIANFLRLIVVFWSIKPGDVTHSDINNYDESCQGSHYSLAMRRGAS
jgi:hypothetical protein